MTCSWYDDRTGTRISHASTVRVHHILDQIRHRAAAKLAHLPLLFSAVSEDEAPKEGDDGTPLNGRRAKKEQENAKISSSGCFSPSPQTPAAPLSAADLSPTVASSADSRVAGAGLSGCLTVKSSDIQDLVQGPAAVPLSASFPAASCVSDCLVDLLEEAVRTATLPRSQKSLDGTQQDFSRPPFFAPERWRHRTGGRLMPNGEDNDDSGGVSPPPAAAASSASCPLSSTEVWLANEAADKSRNKGQQCVGSDAGKMPGEDHEMCQAPGVRCSASGVSSLADRSRSQEKTKVPEGGECACAHQRVSSGQPLLHVQLPDSQERELMFTTLLSQAKCPCTCGNAVSFELKGEGTPHSQLRKKRGKLATISSSAFSGYYPIGHRLLQQLLPPPDAPLCQSGCQDSPEQLCPTPGVELSPSRVAETDAERQEGLQCTSADTRRCCPTCCTGWCVRSRMHLDVGGASQVDNPCPPLGKASATVGPAAAEPACWQGSEKGLYFQTGEVEAAAGSVTSTALSAVGVVGVADETEGRNSLSSGTEAGAEGRLVPAETENSVLHRMASRSSAHGVDDPCPVSSYSLDSSLDNRGTADRDLHRWGATCGSLASLRVSSQKRRSSRGSLDPAAPEKGDLSVTPPVASSVLPLSKASSQAILRPVLPVGSFDDTGSRISAWDLLLESAREVLAEEKSHGCVASGYSGPEETDNAEPTCSRKARRLVCHDRNGACGARDSLAIENFEAPANLGLAGHEGKGIPPINDNCDRLGRRTEETLVKYKERDDALNGHVLGSSSPSSSAPESRQRPCCNNSGGIRFENRSEGILHRNNVSGLSPRLPSAGPEHSQTGPQGKEGPLTEAELLMLMVHLQSRLGYVGDLAEQSISALKNFPFEVAVLKEAPKKRLGLFLPVKDQVRASSPSCPFGSSSVLTAFPEAEAPACRSAGAGSLRTCCLCDQPVPGSCFHKGKEEGTGSEKESIPGSPHAVSCVLNRSPHCSPRDAFFMSFLPSPLPLIRSPPLRWSSSFVRTQQQHLVHALQREQQHPGPRVVPFNASTANSADKVVVEGWAWLPAFLALQVHPYILTQAAAVQVKVKDEVEEDGDREHEGKSADVLEGRGSTGESAEERPEQGLGRSDGENETVHNTRAEFQEDTGASEAWPVCVRVRVNDKELGFTRSHGLIRCKRTWAEYATEERTTEGSSGLFCNEGNGEVGREEQAERRQMLGMKQPHGEREIVTLFE